MDALAHVRVCGGVKGGVGWDVGVCMRVCVHVYANETYPVRCAVLVP